MSGVPRRYLRSDERPVVVRWARRPEPCNPAHQLDPYEEAEVRRFSGGKVSLVVPLFGQASGGIRTELGRGAGVLGPATAQATAQALNKA